MSSTLHLADLTTVEVQALRAGPRPFVVLLPVGSVEPHGPHLPLGTDTFISVAAAERACAALDARGVSARVAPALPYGVTDFAEGFAGAVSLPAEALTSILTALIRAHVTAGAAHVCLVNNHLEPAHDAAVRAATADLEPSTVSVACPLTKRWARTLSDEFKSGACHAGRYETSLVLAARPELVHERVQAELDEVAVSLSRGIRDGKRTFIEMGMDRAYAGAPSLATAAEGEQLLSLLADMIVQEVMEKLDVR